MPKISVIVPVYNVEKYLKRCIDSIISQTFKDFEIILVNDGSTDKSGSICDEYAVQYSNIIVIHKHNKGVSDSRNIGIENANGTLIYFLDSDDYIIPQCLEVLYTNMIKTCAELSCGSFSFFDDFNQIEFSEHQNCSIVTCNGRKGCMSLLYGKEFYSSSCNILIKASIAKNNLFPVGRLHEDEIITFRYFLDASKIVITSMKTYYYYQREGSIMHSSDRKTIFDEVFAADNYVNICKGINKKLWRAALYRKYYLYNSIVVNNPSLKEDELILYSSLIKYLKLNALNIIFDFNAALSTKITAAKYLIKSKII